MWHSVSLWAVLNISRDNHAPPTPSNFLAHHHYWPPKKRYHYDSISQHFLLYWLVFLNCLTLKDECNIFLQNTRKQSPTGTASHHRIPKFSATLLWESQIMDPTLCMDIGKYSHAGGGLLKCSLHRNIDLNSLWHICYNSGMKKLFSLKCRSQSYICISCSIFWIKAQNHPCA